MILQTEIWQATSGTWHVACTSDLAHNSGTYWMLAKGLRLRPAEFILWLADKYKPDVMYTGPDKDYGPVFLYYWHKNNESMARKFHNDVNRLLREKKVDFIFED